MSRTSTRVLLVVVSTLVAAITAEFGLRALDFPPSDFSPWIASPVTAYAYAPLLETRLRREGEFDVGFETNRHGLRDDEITAKADRRRVLVLGDSFASGYGVERGELFADLLERRLGVDVVNGAVGGFEIVHQVHFYQAQGRHFEPDVVLYALYLGNDISRNHEWKETEKGGLAAVGRRLPVRAPESSKLLALADRYLYGRRLRRDDERAEWTPFPDYLRMSERKESDATRAQWELVEGLLLRLQQAIAESGAVFRVATFSHRIANEPAARARYEQEHPEIVAALDFAIPRARIAEVLDRLDVDWIDLDAAIAAHFARSDEPLYFRRDGHWNALGHRVVAAALESPLRAALSAPARVRADGA